MMELLTRKRISTILALALDGGRLEGFVLRRTNGSIRIQKSFVAPLSVNPLATEAELVGREIRNHLDRAGIRERRCAICIPLSWIFTVHTKVPDLPEADLQGFLEIEAERGFPYAPESLYIQHSFHRSPGGDRYVTMAAVSRTNLTQLEAALRAADLKPMSFSLGIAVMQPPGQIASDGVLAIAAQESHVDLQVNIGGGVAVLRSLEEAVESGTDKRMPAAAVAREVRITLGQLPPEFRGAVRTAKVVGGGESVEALVRELRPRLEVMGLRVEAVETYPAGECLPKDTRLSPASSLGAMILMGRAPAFEFRPPTVSPVRQVVAAISSRKLAWAAGVVGAVLLTVGGAFTYQGWQLSRLESEWNSLRPQAVELEGFQRQIRQFRPWYDDSFRTLTILSRVTEAFPEDGVVSARSLEIRNLSTVSCSGTARDNQAFLRMMDQLRASREVSDLKVDQLRGTQFGFNFQWGGGPHEN